MKLLGFNFNKISIVKTEEKPKEIKVSTNIDVSEIKELKPSILKTKDQVFGVKFTYAVNYEPSFAKVDLQGAIILGLEPKLAKEVSKQWEKKKMPADFQRTLFNIILTKSSVKALQLEEEMNLPFHIPLPSVKIENPKSDK